MVDPATPLSVRFMRLCACLAGVAILFWVLLPQLRTISGTWNDMADMIQERDIEVGMFFYTDVAVTGDADLHMRSALARPPEER
jgi:hypothetical protein